VGLRVVTVKLEESVLEEVETIAREEGVSRSEVIRKALMKYLRERRPQGQLITGQGQGAPYTPYRVVKIEV